jgi:predicted HicB family RNase H-like nuclease
MRYRGYTGVLEVDEEAGILYGHVIGLRDMITFQATTVAQAREEFRRPVDSYLEFCASRGEPPEKPLSGRFLVRIDPALHRALAQTAEVRGTSLNALVEQELTRAVSVAEASPTAKRRSAGRQRAKS